MVSSVRHTRHITRRFLEDGDGVEEPQRHTTEALSKQLHSVTTEWGLTDKVTAVVHDNASNVKNIGELNGTRDVGCAAHTLQLSVTKGLDSSRSIQTTIGAVSRLVGHFRRSNIAIQGLRIKQNTMKRPAHPVLQNTVEQRVRYDGEGEGATLAHMCCAE